jgi:5-methylcytosine-specific restriction protein B
MFRRPSDVDGLKPFADWPSLVESFRSYFHLDGEDAPLFDLTVPAGLPDMAAAELERAAVIDVLAQADPATQLGLRLANEEAQDRSTLDVVAAECALKMGQVLLFGPPGTGKTLWAKRAALRILGTDDDSAARATGRLVLVAFHPSSTYEDFVRGLKVEGTKVEPKAGVFQSFCEAAAGSDEPYVMVIDEINRGNTIAILGELLYALEWSKRGDVVRLPDGFDFSVPKNVFILATANTADRSIAALDAALGRRFARVEVPPASSVLGDATVAGFRLADVMDALNVGILESIDREHRLGHSYFLDDEDMPLDSVEDLMFALRYRIIPLIQDYALDDFGVLDSILGPGFVDASTQVIRTSPFGSEAQLKEALSQIPRIKPIPTNPVA